MNRSIIREMGNYVAELEAWNVAIEQSRQQFDAIPIWIGGRKIPPHQQPSLAELRRLYGQAFRVARLQRDLAKRTRVFYPEGSGVSAGSAA